MTNAVVGEGVCFREGLGFGPLLALGLLLALAGAGCHRSVPPNVTPPGETAAFSAPGPAGGAAQTTEISD